MTTIVLVTKGKNHSVDYVKVQLFDVYLDAIEFCEKVTDKEPVKYWTHAEIIEDGHTLELSSPEWPNN